MMTLRHGEDGDTNGRVARGSEGARGMEIREHKGRRKARGEVYKEEHCLFRISPSIAK